MSVGGFVGRLFFKESKMRVLTDLEPKNVFSFFSRIYAVFLIHHTRKNMDMVCEKTPTRF